MTPFESPQKTLLPVVRIVPTDKEKLAPFADPQIPTQQLFAIVVIVLDNDVVPELS